MTCLNDIVSVKKNSGNSVKCTAEGEKSNKYCARNDTIESAHRIHSGINVWKNAPRTFEIGKWLSLINYSCNLVQQAVPAIILDI